MHNEEAAAHRFRGAAAGAPEKTPESWTRSKTGALQGGPLRPRLQGQQANSNTLEGRA